MEEAPKRKEGAGPLIGSIIIVLILVLGAFYFFVTRKDVAVPLDPAIEKDPPVIGEADSQADAEINAELENINAEFQSLEQELNNLENGEA